MGVLIVLQFKKVIGLEVDFLGYSTGIALQPITYNFSSNPINLLRLTNP